MKDLFAISPQQARLIAEIGAYSCTGRQAGIKARVPNGSLYTHLLRLKRMGYIQKEPHYLGTWSLTDLGIDVYHVMLLFNSRREARKLCQLLNVTNIEATSSQSSKTNMDAGSRKSSVSTL